jgi:hypothetical protein
VARLLQRFEQSIRRGFRHCFGGFNHHHSTSGFNGLASKCTTHATNLLEPQLRWRSTTHSSINGLIAREKTTLMLKGGLNPDQVWMIALLKTTPCTITTHPPTQHSLEETQGRKTSSYPVGPSEQVSGGKSVLLQGRFEQMNG